MIINEIKEHIDNFLINKGYYKFSDVSYHKNLNDGGIPFTKLVFVYMIEDYILVNCYLPIKITKYTNIKICDYKDLNYFKNINSL